MAGRLRILFASDPAGGSEHLARELARGGREAEIVCVTDEPSLEAQLTTGPGRWDAVLADPGTKIGVPQALAVVRRASETLPFVVVSHDGLVRALDHALQEAVLRKEHHEVREQLVVAERLASLSFLVQGLAHEINNPLSSIIVNHEFIRAELQRFTGVGADVAEAEGALRDAAEAAGIIRQVVRDLRAFASDNVNDAAVVLDPRPIVESAVRMTWHHIRSCARLTHELGATPYVRANKARLSQVLLNLLVNAAHAIPPGAPNSNEIRVVTSTDARGRLVIEVRDTGTGIAPHHLPRVFDPYFTTKSPGHGTGLGLAVSQRIVHDMGGEISVESETGKGTCFSVVVPSADASEASE